MNEPVANPEGTRRIIAGVYILYLLGIILPVTPLVGIVLAYVYRDDAREWQASHLTFQIRTFWIGLLYGLVSTVTTVFFIGWALGLFTLVWWIVRCVKGLKLNDERRPIENVTTWMI